MKKIVIKVETSSNSQIFESWSEAETYLQRFGTIWTNDPTYLSGYAGGLDTGEALARWRILV